MGCCLFPSHPLPPAMLQAVFSSVLANLAPTLVHQVRSVSKKFFVFPPHFPLGAISPARLATILLPTAHDNNLPPNLRTANFPEKTVKYHQYTLEWASTVLQTRPFVPQRQRQRQPVSASQRAQALAPQRQPSST